MAERWLKHSGLRHHMLALFTTRFPEHENDIGGALLWMLPIADLPPSPLCFSQAKRKENISVRWSLHNYYHHLRIPA